MLESTRSMMKEAAQDANKIYKPFAWTTIWNKGWTPEQTEKYAKQKFEDLLWKWLGKEPETKKQREIQIAMVDKLLAATLEPVWFCHNGDLKYTFRNGVDDIFQA